MLVGSNPGRTPHVPTTTGWARPGRRPTPTRRSIHAGETWPTRSARTAGYQENQIGVLSFSGTMTDYAGTGVAGLLNGPIATARFNWPSGIAIDPCGNLFIADWNNNVVREGGIDPLCLSTPTSTSTWGRLKTTHR